MNHLLMVDTNVWLAAGDRSAREHGLCADLLRRHLGELASTVPVIAETAWLLLDRVGAKPQVRFLDMVAAEEVEAVGLVGADWQRIAELVALYSDLRLDVVDASTIAVAERLGQKTVATLDHRDFRTVRPAHVPAFDLVP